MLIATLLLCLFGLISSYSASAIKSNEMYGHPFVFVLKQSIGIFFGFALILLLHKAPERFLERAPLPFFLFTCLVLSFVLIPGFYQKVGGASRWIRFSFITVQPAEFAKLAFVMLVAKIISRKAFDASNPFSIVLNHGFILIFLTFMLMKQPDFGSTAVIYSLFFLMLFYAGLKLKHFAIGALSITPFAVWAIVSTPYRIRRVLGFLNPWENINNEGFQIVQSYLAFKNGGLLGVGLGNSKQKLFYLPEAHTDFILSVVAEEVGSLGVLLVIALYCYIVYLGFLITERVENYYQKSLAFGLTSLLALQAVLNMGVVLGLLPTKGLTLPFVSSGTSSMVACLLVIGILSRIANTQGQQRNVT